MDTYFRGNSHEVAFCKQVGAGGNHLVVCTAGGKVLGAGRQLKLRQRELAAVLEEYRGLPEGERKAALEDAAGAQPPRRPVPDPPAGGLIIRGYCTYVDLDKAGQIGRSTQYYYKKNPDRWAAETQSDMLWLTAAEARSLAPAEAKPGDQVKVAAAIQRRFFSTIGIDYMEGSVNSLAPRDTRMTLTVEGVTPQAITMRLDGYGRMGKAIGEAARAEAHSRGCELRVRGRVTYNRKSEKFERFDLVGIGRAWGNKMNYTRREISLERYPWMYGVACRLVTGDSPIDRIPPYNLLHYNSTGTYFDEEAP